MIFQLVLIIMCFFSPENTLSTALFYVPVKALKSWLNSFYPIPDFDERGHISLENLVIFCMLFVSLACFHNIVVICCRSCTEWMKVQASTGEVS